MKSKEAGEGVVAGDEGAVLEMADRKVIDMDDPPNTSTTDAWSMTTSLHQTSSFLCHPLVWL